MRLPEVDQDLSVLRMGGVVTQEASTAAGPLEALMEEVTGEAMEEATGKLKE
jgi:hypothetical protein